MVIPEIIVYIYMNLIVALEKSKDMQKTHDDIIRCFRTDFQIISLYTA